MTNSDPVLSSFRRGIAALSCAAAASLLLPACGDASAAYAPTVDGMRSYALSLMDACAAGDQAALDALAEQMVLPAADAWFAQHFPADKAAALTAEYEALLPQFSGLGAVLATNYGEGKTELEVTMLKDAADASAHGNGAQQAAFAAMTEMAPLFTIVMKAPGAERGWRLWSFVHDGTAFRMIGKMRAAG
ncbi:MAG: hypothetical protein AAF628_34375 [Planctomycetota bacterium]